MNYKSLLKIKKYNKIYSFTKYFFYLNNSFVMFRINIIDVHVKFYIKQFFLKYSTKFFFLSKKNYFLYRFKNYNFLLLKFKNFEYTTFFLNVDFNFFDPQDSSLILVALKIKKNILSYSFLKEYLVEDNDELFDFLLFTFYFYLLFKKVFLIKFHLIVNYIYLFNNLLLCQQFIKQHLN